MEAVSVLFSFWRSKEEGLPIFGRRNLRFHRASVGAFLKFGCPIALQDLLTNISFLVVIAIVNSLGLVASAGAGIGEKVCVFIMLIPMSFTSSLSAFVAQNVGAGALSRAKKALYYGIGTSMIPGVVMFFLALFKGDMLAGIFTREPDVAAASAITSGLCRRLPPGRRPFCLIGYCNGNGKTLFTMLQGIFCAFAVRIPLAYLFSRIDGATCFRSAWPRHRHGGRNRSLFDVS